MRVLIVDDQEENLYLLRVTLESRGHQVQSASNGQEALDKALRDPPEIVVSDLMMPVMDGYTLLRRWRHEATLRSIPFVVYTATYTHAQDQELAMGMGAAAYLVKPLDPEVLLRRLDEVHDSWTERESPAHSSDSMERYNEVLFRKLTSKSAALETAIGLYRVAARLGKLGGWTVEFPDPRIRWSDEVCSIHEMPAGTHPDPEQALDFFLPSTRPVVAEAFRRSLEEGQPLDFEAEICTARGRRIWVRVVGEMVADAEGKPRRLQGALQDITESKLAEGEIRELADRLGVTISSITDGFLTIDDQWRVSHINAEAQAVLGRGDRPLLGEDLWRQVPELSGTRFESQLRRSVRECMTLAFEEDGLPTSGWFEVKVFPSRLGLTVLIRDITEQHISRLRLAKQARLIEEASDAIVERDLDGRIVFWSRGAERVYGWTASEALGQPFDRLLQGDPARFESARQAVEASGSWVGESTVKTRAGQTVTLDCRWSLIRDAEGQARSILSLETDITERRALEAQFIRAQRLESVGKLAGGIAHDLGNLLAPILMSVELLRVKESDAERLELFRALEASANRAKALIRRMLMFARGFDGERVAVDMSRLVREIAAICRETFPKNLNVTADIPSCLWRVRGDPTQLHQVLLNLCVNARDAMPNGGKLELVAKNLTLDDQYSQISGRVNAGDYVSLEVRDTGCGIAPENIEAIFEPFFTTKELSRGTGLGLSSSLAIVRGHGGLLWVQSEIGRGTTFRALLPADASLRHDPIEDLRTLPERGNGELVLVVDDEVAVAEVTSQALGAHGYRVVTARDGAEGVARFALEQSEISLVLTDLAMPVMDGWAFIGALRHLDPKVKIVAVSGLLEGQEEQRLTREGIPFLEKPCTTQEMLTTIQQALGAGEALGRESVAVERD